MGRRQVAVVDPLEARRMAAAQLRTLLGQFDLAEFQAQTHAADMVDLLAGLANDCTVAVEVRRGCANDVLDRAYGRPATKARVEMVDATARTGTGATVGEQIEAAKVGSAMFAAINELTMRGIHPDLWPDDVRAVAGDLIAAYSGE